MILPVVWLPEASAELQEAVSFYTNIRPALGLRLLAAVEEAVEAIREAPLKYAVVDKGRRRVGVRRFPHGLFFLVEDGRIVVIACFHGKRNPTRWQIR